MLEVFHINSPSSFIYSKLGIGSQGAQSGMLSHTLSTGITHSVKSLTQTNMYSETQTLQAFTKLGGYRDYVALGVGFESVYEVS